MMVTRTLPEAFISALAASRPRISYTNESSFLFNRAPTENETTVDDDDDGDDERSNAATESSDFLSEVLISTGGSQQPKHKMNVDIPGFKPAVGCYDCSDFLVKNFLARLRSGMKVVKHSSSRWSQSCLVVLRIHSDNHSLYWGKNNNNNNKNNNGKENARSSQPQKVKVNLYDCVEVRHACSLDPRDSWFTGTKTLRQKCHPIDARKSFALVFKNNRTIDLTAKSSDQCKVLVEGFSALCYRLRAASTLPPEKKKYLFNFIRS